MCDDFMDDFDDPCGDDDWDGLEWQDWMIIGPLSEDIAKERREQEKFQGNLFGDNDELYSH